MKLLLENWRKYLAESERADSCGSLYLFEGDAVSKVSFYDTFNTLSESEDDIQRFLENWEKSVDYQLSPLNEITVNQLKSDPVLAIANQAWLVLDKFKDKAVNKVVSAARKLKKFESENPKTAKVIKFSIGGLLSAAIAYQTYKIVQAGGDASQLEQLAQSIQDIAPEMTQNVSDAAQDFTPEVLSDLVADQEKVVSQTADALGSLGDAGADQIGQSADQLAQDLESVSSEAANWIENLQQQIVSGLEQISTSLKDKVGIDIRAGSKFLAGSESALTEKDLSAAEYEFLTDFVREITENGQEDYAHVDYDTWDSVAGPEERSNLTTAFDDDDGARDASACHAAQDAGLPLPGWCFGQSRKDPVLSQNIAVQFKRTLGQTNVTQIGDGIYEVGGPKDPYNFNKGESSVSLFKELTQILSDLTDEKNDQKVYTTLRKLFGLRHRTGYEGYPVKIIVDISKGAV